MPLVPLPPVATGAIAVSVPSVLRRYCTTILLLSLVWANNCETGATWLLLPPQAANKVATALAIKIFLIICFSTKFLSGVTGIGCAVMPSARGDWPWGFGR